MRQLTRNFTAEKQRRLIISSDEVEDLDERPLLCPYCEFRIENVFSDATGHFRIKCQKCKRVSVINIRYFRRLKRVRRYYTKP